MYNVKRRSESAEPAPAEGPKLVDAMWDDLLDQVTRADQPQNDLESWRQIVEEVEIKDPDQLREFKRRTQQQAPGH